VLEVNARFRRLTRRAAAYGAAAAVHVGSGKETAIAVEGLLRLDPRFRIRAFLKFEPYRDAQHAKDLADDLRTAGLPA
jgi:hypothetical protein